MSSSVACRGIYDDDAFRATHSLILLGHLQPYYGNSGNKNMIPIVNYYKLAIIR